MFQAVERPHLYFAGIIDQNVESPESLDHLPDQRLDFVLVSYIAKKPNRLDALPLQAFTSALQFFRVTSAERDARSAPAQLISKRQPKAARPGNQDRLAAQVYLLCIFHKLRGTKERRCAESGCL